MTQSDGGDLAVLCVTCSNARALIVGHQWKIDRCGKAAT